MNQEMPAMASSQYAHTHHNIIDYAGQALGTGGPNPLAQQQHFLAQRAALPIHQLQKPKKEIDMPVTTARRIVQVFVADVDENVPLDKCVLYTGEQKLTDLTDQELFFELDIKNLLDRHNEQRVKLVNKSVRERTEMLEPARIRDLKMTVVTVATF